MTPQPGIVVKPKPPFDLLLAREAYGHLRDATHRWLEDVYCTTVLIDGRPTVLGVRETKAVAGSCLAVTSSDGCFPPVAEFRPVHLGARSGPLPTPCLTTTWRCGSKSGGSTGRRHRSGRVEQGCARPVAAVPPAGRLLLLLDAFMPREKQHARVQRKSGA
ncbi:MAG TPA: hypothetical protein VMW83_15400 [Spirochaetia bacterium]|nr:hypothetical protein [Spirochaetia bacterium]